MLKKYWKKSVIIFLGMLLLPVIFVFSVYCGLFGHLQTKGELLSYKNANATTVLSSEGELIGNIFSQNRTNISSSQIPANLINALVATEDFRFFEHKGIDSRSLFRVLFKSLLLNDRRSGGGSTITQQLAKNMFGRKKAGRLSMLVIKTKEVIIAHRLEKSFTKEEILTLYLNTVSFGENIYGIGTASRRYFNKKTENLTLEESAVLVGMLKANTFYNPRLHPENALARRNVVLRQLEKHNYINSPEADSLCKLPLIQNFTDVESDGPADYFLVRVKDEAGKILQNVESTTGKEWNIEEDGLVITTTLNLTLQKYALESFREHLSVMQKRLREQYQSTAGKRTIKQIADQELKSMNLTDRAGEINLRQIFDWEGSHSDSISVGDSLKQALLILHAGFLAIDPQSGSVRAWVGGIDFKSQPYDQIYARRQMASSFKPILYAEAFEQGIDPCLYLDNDSITIHGIEDWTPENYDHTHGGKYTLAGALTFSMNIPTVNLFLQTRFQKLDSLWIKMGFSYNLDSVPSVALGTAEASILEEAIAYSSFANGGYKVSPQCIYSIKAPDGEIIYQNEFSAPKEKVLGEKSATLIRAILQKAVREGTGASMGSVYGINLPLAGKTGTSQDYSDAWFTVFNPKLVVVTRVGASSRAIHFNNGSYGSGSTLALPLVALTLKKVQKNDTLRRQLFSEFPDLSPELVAALDCPEFKEKNLVDKFLDLFHGKKKPANDLSAKPKEKQKKKGFFRRLFGKKN
jgi:penicillin-binding protein 1A